MNNSLGKLLTICIPTYNRSSALDSCLFSICTQVEWDSVPIEIIISDNASTDDTKLVVEKWSSKFNYINYYRNDSNIGGIRNFWKITEYVRTKYFWFLGDDALLIPGSIKHLFEIINLYTDASFIMLSGTNNAKDQSPIIQNLIKEQGGIVKAIDKNEFICSFWLQNLGCISYLVFSTEKWRKTNYGKQPPYFIYPQIRSVLEVCADNGDIIFSNRYCVHNYRADSNHNLWYINKGCVSILFEFPWLQKYAKQLGFDKKIKNGLHKDFFSWKLKQWIRMLVFHPYYNSLYKDIFSIQEKRRDRIVMYILMIFILPFNFFLKKLAKSHGKSFIENDELFENS